MNLFWRIYGTFFAITGIAYCIWAAKMFYDLKKLEEESFESSKELKDRLQKMLDEHPEWVWDEDQKTALRKMGYTI